MSLPLFTRVRVTRSEWYPHANGKTGKTIEPMGYHRLFDNLVYFDDRRVAGDMGALTFKDSELEVLEASHA